MRTLRRTGTRVNELLDITLSAIEFQNQVVNITEAKGGKQRRVSLDSETLSRLSDYISQHNIQENQPIFGMKRWQIHAIIKKYGKMTGFDIYPHTFRQPFLVTCSGPDLILRLVQQLLGHSNLITTQVYLQFNDQDSREGYNKIEF
jgi:integrase/recombinase XerD